MLRQEGQHSLADYQMNHCPPKWSIFMLKEDKYNSFCNKNMISHSMADKAHAS